MEGKQLTRGLNYGKQGILCVNSAFMLLMLSLEKDIYTLTSYEQLNQTHDRTSGIVQQKAAPRISEPQRSMLDFPVLLVRASGLCLQTE